MRSKRQTLDYSEERRPSAGRRSASFGLLGGGIAWLLHLLSAYVISEFGCAVGWGERIVLGLSVVAWLLLIATAITAALAGVAAWASAHNGKAVRTAPERAAVAPAENTFFTARLSLVLNGMFLFIILVQGIPIFFYLRSC